MNESISNALINHYLQRCADLTDKLLEKAVQTNQITDLENKLARDINHVANVLTAIHFYRQEKDLNLILEQMSIEQRQVLEPNLRIIWKYLAQYNDSDISQLAMETIQASSYIAEQIENTLTLNGGK